MPAKLSERVLSYGEIARLAGAVEMLTSVGASIQTINAATTEHVGYENAVALPKLATLVSDMTGVLRAALVRRDPSLAPPPEAPTGATTDAEAASAAAATPAAFASRAEVDAALASAFGYFATSEPTSPALLLIRQAREMLGKNLYEVMKLLAPPHADAARVFVGPDGAFTVPVTSLSNAPSPAIPTAPSEPAASRAAAIALTDAVAAHMQKAELSSPCPICSIVHEISRRATLSLLQDLLSDEAIASEEGEVILTPRVGEERRPVAGIKRVDLREGDRLQAAAPAISAVGDELAAVDAHGRQAGHEVRGVVGGRGKIDEAALQGPANGRRAGAGSRDPPPLRSEGLTGVRPDRDIDERVRLVADAKVGAGGDGKDDKQDEGEWKTLTPQTLIRPACDSHLLPGEERFGAVSPPLPIAGRETGVLPNALRGEGWGEG
jgi:hypothetical protein